jgi:hypothetical protein
MKLLHRYDLNKNPYVRGLSKKCNILTAEIMSKYKESRRELKINAFLCDYPR